MRSSKTLFDDVHDRFVLEGGGDTLLVVQLPIDCVSGVSAEDTRSKGMCSPDNSLECVPGFTLMSTLNRWGRLRKSLTRIERPIGGLSQRRRMYASALRTDERRHAAVRYGRSELEEQAVAVERNVLCVYDV